MSAGLDQALEAAAGAEGWLTDDQARRLFHAGTLVRPGGRIVEIGSYRGRSAIILATAAGPDVEVVAIDPHAGNDRGPRQIEGSLSEGEADHLAFQANLRRAGVADSVRHVRLPSQAALGELEGQLAVLYVDGAHRYGPALADLVRWGARLSPGGRLLVHDAFSSVGVTLAIVRHLVFGRSFVYRGRDGSLAEYERAAVPLRPREVAANAARQLAQLPWFVRNVAIKLLIVARLRRVAVWIGLRPGDEWPY